LNGHSSDVLSARRMRKPRTAKEASALPAHICASGVAAVLKALSAREKAAPSPGSRGAGTSP
jgi:hypothetical protein